MCALSIHPEKEEWAWLIFTADVLLRVISGNPELITALRVIIFLE